ncbi:hypothetical protein [Streptomyces hainanensis]|uniref:Uncharacterized protein n=1 Tax=Streptomyces hainanensis TaxID=402648 RepID=A0A4R4TEZ0_9ACTN|nr:hypothetical protein [Streptomyces hainanensis]TDC76121.1 hypothetical protein E1283_10530 [Streptomyces hainanensis]
MCWGNIIQFLASTGTGSAERLGTGLVLATPEAEPPAGDEPTPLEREAWGLVFEQLVYIGDPEIDALARRLADRAVVPVARPGYDVEGIPRPLELAWPAGRIGVVLHVDTEDPTSMRCCREAGWQVRAPGGWTPDELAALLSAEGERR